MPPVMILERGASVQIGGSRRKTASSSSEIDWRPALSDKSGAASLKGEGENEIRVSAVTFFSWNRNCDKCQSFLALVSYSIIVNVMFL